MINAENLIPKAGNLDNFIKHFPIFIAAPDGISKLKGLILELAVTGKLVPQIKKELSSEILLGEIKAIKNDLLKQKLIGKQSIYHSIKNNKKPFIEPEGWIFVRLGEICNRIGSGSTPRGGKSAYVDEGIPFLRSQNIRNEGLKLDNVAFIPIETHVKMANTKVIADDVLLNITGASLGRCALVSSDFDEANVSQHVSIIRPTKSEISSYLHLCMLSPYTQKMIWGRQVGMAREGLSKKVLEQFEIPLPSLEEQKRIVAKMDELVAMVDKLHAQQLKQANTVLQANTASINALLNSPEGSSFEENWNRISTHFNTLYGCTLPMPKGDGRQKKHLVGLENVRALKASILKLAMLGKLTSQKTEDGCVETLVDQLVSTGEKLREKKGIRKVKKITLKNNFAPSQSIPDNWKWVTLDTICYQVTDGVHHTPKYTDTGVHFLSVKDLTSGGINLDNTRFISMASHNDLIKRCHPERGDILLTKIGTTGVPRSISIDTPFSLFVSVALLKFANEFMNIPFFEYLLASPLVRQQSADGTQGVGNKNLVLKTIRAFHLPIPPLEEQKRIVAKVDELMSICDKLEEQLTQAYTDAETLMQATIKSLVA